MQKVLKLENNQKEYILCAAIYYDNGKKYEHQPKNIESGIVVCGRRHHNCFIILFNMFAEDDYSKKNTTQGFLTNTDRFVDRQEAAQIAFGRGQIKIPTKSLFSEDLY